VTEESLPSGACANCGSKQPLRNLYCSVCGNSIHRKEVAPPPLKPIVSAEEPRVLGSGPDLRRLRGDRDHELEEDPDFLSNLFGGVLLCLFVLVFVFDEPLIDLTGLEGTALLIFGSFCGLLIIFTGYTLMAKVWQAQANASRQDKFTSVSGVIRLSRIVDRKDPDSIFSFREYRADIEYEYFAEGQVLRGSRLRLLETGEPWGSRESASGLVHALPRGSLVTVYFKTGSPSESTLSLEVPPLDGAGMLIVGALVIAFGIWFILAAIGLVELEIPRWVAST
jgi:hypothetical protein